MDYEKLQMELFEKEKGMRRSASKHPFELLKAREIAEDIGSLRGECSIEDVRDVWGDSFPKGSAKELNWCGSVFKEKEKWEFLRFDRSWHEKGHAHMVRVWRYKNENKKLYSVPVQETTREIQRDYANC